MNTFLASNKFIGFSIFSSPENWQYLLSELPNSRRFFFQFDEEKGNHLNVFFYNIQPLDFQKIEEYLNVFLIKSENTYLKPLEDLLFKNYDNNVIVPIYFAETTNDLVFNSKLKDNSILNLLFQISRILKDSLHYNNFFLIPKNRLNFAIQLVLLVLTKLDSVSVIKQLKATTKEDKFFKIIFENGKEGLMNLLRGIHQIEQNQETEKWVIDWIETSNDFLKKTDIVVLIEVICYILNIKQQKNQLIYLVRETLKCARVEI